MKTLYDDYEVVKKLDRRNHNQYYQIRCTVCGHEKQCSEQNILKQDNHHSCKNCHGDYYKNMIGKQCGDYVVEGIEYVSKEKGYVASMRCSVCGHRVKVHPSSGLERYHNAFVCEEDYHRSIVGKTYGDLTVVGVSGEKRSGAILYNCECRVCGIRSVETMPSLKKNIVHGTHCLKLLPDDEVKKVVVQRFYNMYQRCNNPNNQNYPHYGARGIKLLYDNAIDLYFDFADEIKEYAKTHDIRNCTFDRIDVNGNYEKDNLRIATQTIQSTNTTRKRLFIIEKGNERVLSDSAMECGRCLGANGRSLGNVIRGTSKSASGWRLRRFVDEYENIEDVIKKENITLKLIVS